MPFREKFYYSNVMYMSAGVAASKAENTDWDTLVKERIFEPLGMDTLSRELHPGGGTGTYAHRSP